MSREEEYLEEIRRAERLSRAVLDRIVAEGDTVIFRILTDKSYTEEDVAFAEEVSKKYTPSGYTAKVRLVKSVPDGEGIRRAIGDFLRTKFPSAAAFISPEDITVEIHESGGAFVIAADESERAHVLKDGIADAAVAELNRRFCGSYTGGFRFYKKDLGEIEYDRESEERVAAPRFFPVEKYAPIDGAAPESAVYIADLTKEAQGITVCGTVSYIEERETKKGKPYFSVTVSDGSGSMRAAYFSKKATLEKVRTVKAGDGVCLTGDNELFNGALSFRVKAIDFGTPPEGFVPKARPSRPVPVRYKKVLPLPVSDFVQSDLFGAEVLPEDLKRGRFVVFDLETTGLNNSVSGIMDRIIEIGAVKVTDGKICEKFSSFVACPVRLSDEIIALTGIDDGMLAGAPEISDVIADFYKFCDGCVLVGHNVQFDYKFVRYYGEKEGYIFNHRQYDTVAFAQELLRLSNYKLNTVADYFGFSFNHHRAFDDAFVTAKIFIELCKKKKGLPEGR